MKQDTASQMVFVGGKSGPSLNVVKLLAGNSNAWTRVCVSTCCRCCADLLSCDGAVCPSGVCFILVFPL